MDTGYLVGETAATFEWQSYVAKRCADFGVPEDVLLHTEFRVELCRLDPLLFALVYLRSHLTDRVSGEITFGEMHLDLCRQAQLWSLGIGGPRENRDIYIGPREMGKSTWLFTLLPLWAAAFEYVRFVAAFADSGDQAQEHLKTFRSELDENALLRLDFPDLCASKVRIQANTKIDSSKEMLQQANGFIFRAKGINTANLGLKVGSARPDLIILDDIEKGEENYSAYKIEGRLKTVIQTILPMSDTARVLMVGTVTMNGSIIHQSVKHAEHRRSGGKAGQLAEWVEEQNFLVHHYLPIILDESGERSIWPGKWPMEFLHRIVNTADYALNFKNMPTVGNGDYWALGDIEYGKLPGVTKVFLSIDPAVTSTATSDYTGLAILGFEPAPVAKRASVAATPAPVRSRRRGAPASTAEDTAIERALSRCEVRWATQVKLGPKAMRSRTIEILNSPLGAEIQFILVEVNQGQDYVVETFQGLGVPVVVKHQSVNKEVRAAKVSRYYKAPADVHGNKRVVHWEKFADAEEQMHAFPRTANDDIVDAIGTGVEHCFTGVTKKRQGRVAARSHY